MFFSLVLGLTDIFISSLLLFGFLPPSSLCMQSSHVALILVFTPCPRVNMAWAAKGQRGRTRDGYPTFLQPVGVCGSASCLCSVPHRIVAQQGAHGVCQQQVRGAHRCCGPRLRKHSQLVRGLAWLAAGCL